jgi:hypothetical protein
MKKLLSVVLVFPAIGLVALVACGKGAENGSEGSPGDDVPAGAGAQATGELVGDGGAAPAPPYPGPPPVDPDALDPDSFDVESVVKGAEDRKPISPLLYGMNTIRNPEETFDVMPGVTWVRRGGDRANAYNWETNISNGAFANNWANDTYLAGLLGNPNAPGELDRALIEKNRAAGRATMVPFVMNHYVAGPVSGPVPYMNWGWPIDNYFRRVEVVKPTPYSDTPDVNDGVVYTDEHVYFLKKQFRDDIYAPGPTQVMIGTDNEPDIYAFNFPMLQRGGGSAIYRGGTQIGTRVLSGEFVEKFLRFAKRVKEFAPNAAIVGPDHYHYDGWTTWWYSASGEYSDKGRWFMDDFLATVRAESEKLGTRLLDTWDFHWYPQRVFDGTDAWMLDHSARRMTEEEIEAVVQGPRSYWDPTYDEHSWITDDHLKGPAFILTRLFSRVDAAYPGTHLGVTEYFPGGCAHISSGLATADTLGVFARMGVHLAAMWPHKCDPTYAFGGFKLFRDADGHRRSFAGTSVRVEHPEVAESSVHAGSDHRERVTAVVINKTRSERRFGLRIFDAAPLTKVSIHRIDASHASPEPVLETQLTKVNAYVYVAPPMSAALLDFTAR